MNKPNQYGVEQDSQYYAFRDEYPAETAGLSENELAEALKICDEHRRQAMPSGLKLGPRPSSGGLTPRRMYEIYQATSAMLEFPVERADGSKEWYLNGQHHAGCCKCSGGIAMHLTDLKPSVKAADMPETRPSRNARRLQERQNKKAARSKR